MVLPSALSTCKVSTHEADNCRTQKIVWVLLAWIILFTSYRVVPD